MGQIAFGAAMILQHTQQGRLVIDGFFATESRYTLFGGTEIASIYNRRYYVCTNTNINYGTRFFLIYNSRNFVYTNTYFA